MLLSLPEISPEPTAHFSASTDQAEALWERGLAGFVYTQVSDVEDESNGILTFDRRINKLEDD